MAKGGSSKPETGKKKTSSAIFRLTGTKDEHPRKRGKKGQGND